MAGDQANSPIVRIPATQLLGGCRANIIEPKKVWRIELGYLPAQENEMKKAGRNQQCPCGSGKKYKQCCLGSIDWNNIFENGHDWNPHLSIRGRNIQFANRLTDILGFDAVRDKTLAEYKSAFTATAVRDIHEAILETWPPDMNISAALEKTSDDVSGLYIGDYGLESILRGIVRHSIYANKILIIDPFVYPLSVRDEFNPLLSPEQYRAQTLKNANFWWSLIPWIDAGIVEIIRTPDDFDRALKWESLNRQMNKFKENKELAAAAKISVEAMSKKYEEKEAFRHLILGAPDSYLESKFEELGLEKDGITAKDFIASIQKQRDRDPDFLETLNHTSDSAQLYLMTTGASYDIAQLTASITRSYLVTDLHVKWKEIEIDREVHNAECRVWSPFAKALQNSPLKYLNQLQLEHALKLRSEGRLESLRTFLLRVWKQACIETPFDETNARHLAEELRHETAIAEKEWKQIHQDLLKWIGGEITTGLLVAGQLIAAGHAQFLAAAGVTVGATTLAAYCRQRKQFPDRFPAAFFMDIDGKS